MATLKVVYWLVGILVSGGLLLLSVTSVREREARAAWLSMISACAVALAWYGFFFAVGESLHLLWPTVIVAGLITLFFFPIGRVSHMHIKPTGERVDERSVMFAREEYEPGSDKYRDYYADHPEHQEFDDRLRRLPRLLEPGGRYYEPDVATDVRSIFNRIAGMTRLVDGPVSSPGNAPDPGENAAHWKAWVLSHGAADVGIALMRPEWVYSHVGRGPETWGAPIVNNHRYAIVFSMEMAFDAVAEAPNNPIIRESSRQYLRAAETSVEMARRIRQLGYPARAHISDSNYQVMLPPLAQAAGLGEVGRMGYLISPREGGRIRLGAVTTDLPLEPDHEMAFGVQDFCQICLKCARNCPSQAIPGGFPETVRGVEKWLLDAEKCIYFWRIAGTDCGLCMKVCPYSHPPYLVHNLVRFGIRRSAVARRLASWADDLFYGRTLKQARM